MLAALDLSPRASGVPPGRSGVRVVDLLRVTVLLSVLANLARVPVLSTGMKSAPILLTDLLVVAALFFGSVVVMRRRRLIVDLPAGLGLAFAAVGAVSALLSIPRFGLSAFEVLFSLAYLVRWLVYFAIYVIAINVVFRPDALRLWGAVERMILVFAGFGIFQSIFLPGFAQMVYPDSQAYVDWDIQGHRLVSTYLDPNFAGGLIAMGLLVLVARAAFGTAVPAWKLLLLGAALLMTVSRSSILGFVAGAGLLLVVRGPSRRLLKLGGMALLVLLPFLPLLIRFALSFGKFSVEGSAMHRVIAWLRAIEIFADHPVLGVGFNTYGFVARSYGFAEKGNASFGLDGGLLFIAVMTGMVGVLVYSAMVAATLGRCRRLWRDEHGSPEERALGLGVAAATVALVVHSVFLNSLLYPALMLVMWILWAAVFAATREAPPRGGDVRVAAPPAAAERVPVDAAP